jgi:hypothetical protein
MNDDVVSLHRHSGGAFALPLPTGWECQENVHGCALIAVEPAREDEHLRPTVVVTIEPLVAGETLDAWTARSLEGLRESLQHHRLLDVQAVDVAGRGARRALSHYVNRVFGGVCLEQWLVPVEEVGYVISCTTPALEYDDLFEVMHTVGEGLTIG